MPIDPPPPPPWQPFGYVLRCLHRAPRRYIPWLVRLLFVFNKTCLISEVRPTATRFVTGVKYNVHSKYYTWEEARIAFEDARKTNGVRESYLSWSCIVFFLFLVVGWKVQRWQVDYITIFALSSPHSRYVSRFLNVHILFCSFVDSTREFCLEVYRKSCTESCFLSIVVLQSLTCMVLVVQQILLVTSLNFSLQVYTLARSTTYHK